MVPFPLALLLPFLFNDHLFQLKPELGPEEEVNLDFKELLDSEDEVEPPRTPLPRETRRLRNKRKFDLIWEKWDVDKRTKGKEAVDPNFKKGPKL
jgi:hypothetical protein